MKNFIRLYFKKLTMEKGEDIFEYGFGDFDTEKFLEFLFNNKFINEEKFNELIEDDAELFQIIQEIYEHDYEMCLSVFTDYILVSFNEDKIVDILVSAAY